MKLHKAQLAFRRSRALYRGFVGGRGAGKSFAGAYDLLRRLRPGRSYLVGSPTGVILMDTTYPTFKGMAESFGVWGGARLSPYPTAKVLLEGGDAEVRFRSAEHPDRLAGPNLSDAWLDEASLMAGEAFDVAIGCLREGGRLGGLSATFTPKALDHWTAVRFGADPPAPDTETFHAATRDNPFLPAGFEAALRRQYDDLTAERELEGRFVDVEGSEWPPSYFGPGVWFDDWPPGVLLAVVALDPSRGREAKDGDYAAYVVLKLTQERAGTDRAGKPAHEWLLWADAAFSRENLHAVVGRGVQLVKENHPVASVVVETNIGQELLVSEFASQQRAAGALFAVDGVENHVAKAVRVRRLGKYLARGRIRFRGTPGGRLLVSQLRQFPHGRHDDGPDALEMAVRRVEQLVNGGR